ncbi:hypothetical protein ZWY2020_011292 [Hordeum vulgare]|nr:hypothetical protein ZWY2020_011292 [Hordeum vulgare]
MVLGDHAITAYFLGLCRTYLMLRGQRRLIGPNHPEAPRLRLVRYYQIPLLPPPSPPRTLFHEARSGSLPSLVPRPALAGSLDILPCPALPFAPAWRACPANRLLYQWVQRFSLKTLISVALCEIIMFDSGDVLYWFCKPDAVFCAESARTSDDCLSSIPEDGICLLKLPVYFGTNNGGHVLYSMSQSQCTRTFRRGTWKLVGTSKRVLRWLDRMKPSAQIRHHLQGPPGGSPEQLRHLSTMNKTAGAQKPASKTSTHDSSGRCCSPLNIRPKSFPILPTMMKSTRSARAASAGASTSPFLSVTARRKDMMRASSGRTLPS